MATSNDDYELDDIKFADHAVLIVPQGVAVSPQVLQENRLKRKKLRKKLIVWEGPHISDYASSKLFHYKFLVVKGTVFDIRRWFVWLQLGVLLCISIAVGIYVHFSWKASDLTNSQADSWGVHLQTAATASSNMVIFLLGFYTTTVINRWWEMRLALLRVEGAAIVLAMLASTYLRNSETQNSKKMLTNYALMVRALMAKQLAQLGAGGSGTVDCSDLMSQEIMTHREWGVLQNAHNRIAVILTWMNKLLVLAVAENRLVIPEVSLPPMQNAILDMRALMSMSSCIIESQLPFPYVHLLTMLVKFALLMQAASLGQQAGSLIERGHSTWIPFNILQLILYNFFYQGLLEIQVILWNPYRVHPAHFPNDLYWRRLKASVANVLSEDNDPPFDMTPVDRSIIIGTRI